MSIGRTSGSRYMARLRATGADLGTGHNNNIRWMTVVTIVQIIDTPHKFRTYVYFTRFAFYIALRCGFDKHLYLTSCLNAHNHSTRISLPQTGCIARKMALFIISEDHQTQVQNNKPAMPWQPP